MRSTVIVTKCHSLMYYESMSFCERQIIYYESMSHCERQIIYYESTVELM